MICRATSAILARASLSTRGRVVVARDRRLAANTAASAESKDSTNPPLLMAKMRPKVSLARQDFRDSTRSLPLITHPPPRNQLPRPCLAWSPYQQVRSARRVHCGPSPRSQNQWWDNQWMSRRRLRRSSQRWPTSTKWKFSSRKRPPSRKPIYKRRLRTKSARCLKSSNPRPRLSHRRPRSAIWVEEPTFRN